MNLLKKFSISIRKNTTPIIDQDLKPSNDKKIVYSIACHKNASQVIRLMKAIYHPDNLYYINIDHKATLLFYKKLTTSRFLKRKNIYFTNNQVDWGGWNQVQVVLDIMENALKVDSHWTHFINLSGQDFPLKNQEFIHKELAGQINKSFIEADYLPPETQWSERLFSYRPLGHKKEEKALRLDLKFPDIKFYKGSQWMVLARNFCEYSLSGELPKTLKPFFKVAYIPDESFFPTMGGNWEFENSISWHNKHYIDWSTGGAHPVTLTMKDLDKIITSDNYFARKFDKKVDPKIIKVIEEAL